MVRILMFYLFFLTELFISNESLKLDALYLYELLLPSKKNEPTVKFFDDYSWRYQQGINMILTALIQSDNDNEIFACDMIA